MKNTLRILLLLSLASIFNSCGKDLKCPASDILEHVDPRIGTDTWKKKSTLSQAERPAGYVYPGVAKPFAMTQWTPQTNLGGSSYKWYENKIQGFRASHYPNGAAMSEYGSFTIMPTTGSIQVAPAARASSYDHAEEVAKPHYYSVKLQDYDIFAEVTANEKAGYLRFTYPESNQANIIIDNPQSLEGSWFKVIPERNELEGFITNAGRWGNMGYTGREFACYFVARFNKEFEQFHLVPSPDYTPMEHLFSNGLEINFYNNTELKGRPQTTKKEYNIDYEWAGSPCEGIPADGFSASVTGQLHARKAGRHTFSLTTDDGVRLFINGQKVIDSWRGRGATTDTCSLVLKEGEDYDVRIEYFEGAGEACLKFRCIEPLGPAAGDPSGIAIKGASASAACLSFHTKKGETIEMKVGTSFISADQARRNLDQEIGNRTFNQIKKETAEAWETSLSKIQIETSDYNKDIFYTALQRCHLVPRNITENGYHYSAFNGKIMPGTMYTDFSLWDTFRSLHPLLLLIETERVNDMIDALLNSYDEGGWIPKWPNPGYSNIMHGTHGDAVIADAYIKGVRGYDENKAMEAMMKNATTMGTGKYVARVGILDFIKLGFVPTDKHGESAIRTLEFSYDDFCIAQMAKEMGNEELYTRMMKRACNWRNILDPETKMVRGRNHDGSWRSPKDPSISGWAAGSDRDRETYFRNITLFVPHDVKGLAEFMGGASELENYLDYFFSHDFYYVGDEYSMHSPYMYNEIGCPWKTQKQIRQLIGYYFTNEAGGLPGNDDCGQLSSWYVFGALGIYPTCPGKPIYQIGSPTVDKASVVLQNGKTFTIETENNSKENVYIQEAFLNGKPYSKSWIHHDDIISGGTLLFKMGKEPNKEWGLD